MTRMSSAGLAARLAPGVELVIVLVGVWAIVASADAELAALLSWDVLAFGYLVGGGTVMWARARRAPGGRPGRHVDGVRARLIATYQTFFPVLVSLLGATAAIEIVVDPDQPGTDAPDVLKVLAPVAMILAWLLLHAGYARRYRWIHTRHGGGLDFPRGHGLPRGQGAPGEQGEPSEVDFLYFAMTIGASFATSDVEVVSTRMRWHVLVHSVLGFFYNAVVLAVAFRIVTGS